MWVKRGIDVLLDFFQGNSQAKVDEKLRCSFPREFRRRLDPKHGNQVTVTIGYGGNLVLYPARLWEETSRKILRRAKSPQLLEQAEKAIMMAHDVVLDAQNRITLTRELMNWAGIDRTVAFCGMLDTVRLCTPERLAAVVSGNSEQDHQAFDTAMFELMRDDGDE